MLDSQYALITILQVSSMNVDQLEIDKFSAIASRWWDENGEFKPLHQINPLPVDYIISGILGKARPTDGFAKNALAGLNILDVGCGGGILAEALVKHGAKVTGIDLAEESLTVARLHGLENGIKVDYQLISAEDFAAAHPQKFDVVTCLEMLEHVPDPSAIVAAVAQLAKPDAPVFFSTLNRNPKAYLMAIIGAEYVLNLVPKGTHDFSKFIKPSELMRMIDKTDLTILSTTGLHFNPLTNDYYLSNKNIDVNYIVQCRLQDKK